MINLDLEAVKVAQDIISETNDINKKKEIENLVTKTLGVLQENGVFACILYLYSLDKNSSSSESIIRRKLIGMTKLLDKKYEGNDKAEDMLKFLIDNICNDFDTLFLTKDLWERTLIYARYGAKAMEQ